MTKKKSAMYIKKKSATLPNSYSHRGILDNLQGASAISQRSRRDYLKEAPIFFPKKGTTVRSIRSTTRQ